MVNTLTEGAEQAKYRISEEKLERRISEEKRAAVKKIAEDLFARNPDWVTFYREIFGLHGIIRHTFSSRESLVEFERSDSFQEIQQMLTRLREQRPLPNDPEEPTRVITVRLPKSLHEALRAEAHEHHTSMNKLCISKLVQFIENQMVPTDT